VWWVGGARSINERCKNQDGGARAIGVMWKISHWWPSRNQEKNCLLIGNRGYINKLVSRKLSGQFKEGKIIRRENSAFLALTQHFLYKLGISLRSKIMILIQRTYSSSISKPHMRLLFSIDVRFIIDDAHHITNHQSKHEVLVNL